MLSVFLGLARIFGETGGLGDMEALGERPGLPLGLSPLGEVEPFTWPASGLEMLH